MCTLVLEACARHQTPSFNVLRNKIPHNVNARLFIPLPVICFHFKLKYKETMILYYIVSQRNVCCCFTLAGIKLGFFESLFVQIVKLYIHSLL